MYTVCCYYTNDYSSDSTNDVSRVAERIGHSKYSRPQGDFKQMK